MQIDSLNYIILLGSEVNLVTLTRSFLNENNILLDRMYCFCKIYGFVHEVMLKAYAVAEIKKAYVEKHKPF